MKVPKETKVSENVSVRETPAVMWQPGDDAWLRWRKLFRDGDERPLDLQDDGCWNKGDVEFTAGELIEMLKKFPPEEKIISGRFRWEVKNWVINHTRTDCVSVDLVCRHKLVDQMIDVLMQKE